MTSHEYEKTEKVAEEVSLYEEGSDHQNSEYSERTPEGNLLKIAAEIAGENESKEHQNVAMESIIYVLQILFRYGVLSTRHIQRILSRPPGFHLEKMLKIAYHQNEKIFFHTRESLEFYASLIESPPREFTSKALFNEKFPINMLPVILKEIDIHLALEQSCKKSKRLSCYDFLSAHNPRKSRDIKIRRCDGKRGSILADFLVILRKTRHQEIQEMCMVFDLCSSYGGFTGGEVAGKYTDLLLAYDAWLCSGEHKQKWIKKLRLDISPNSLSVALVLPISPANLVQDLLRKCRESGINSPIYFADMEALLARPLSCWHTCFSPSDGEMFLKTQK